MPARIAKLCRRRGCRELTREPSGYCQAHEGDTIGWRKTHRQVSAAERGYDAAWRRLRDWVMRRDNGLCQPCLRAGRVTAATEVDHIIGKAEAKRMGWTRADADAHDNLQAICRECHKVKTAQDSRKGRR